MEMRNANSTEALKEKFKHEKENKDHLDTETREGQIHLARLRLQNSNLNANLYSINLSETPACDCGNASETTEHYLLECPRYHEIRNDLFQEIDFIQYLSPMILLSGSSKLTRDQNTQVIQATQTFILKSKRFKT